MNMTSVQKTEGGREEKAQEKRAKRRDRMENILASLLDAAVETGELLEPLVDAYFSLHERSYRKSRAALSGSTWYANQGERERREAEEKRRFRNALNYLKTQGFVSPVRRGRNFLWHLTSEGRARLLEIRAGRVSYEKEQSNRVVVVSYDIPERMREKRTWVRDVLKFLEYSMVHQSVWIGTNRIPEDFLRDARKSGIGGCLHIFEVGKHGTLSQVQ